MSENTSVISSSGAQNGANTLTPSTGSRIPRPIGFWHSYVESDGKDDDDSTEQQTARRRERTTANSKRASSVPTQHNRKRFSSPPPTTQQTLPSHNSTSRRRPSSVPPDRRTSLSSLPSRVRFKTTTSFTHRANEIPSSRSRDVTADPDDDSSGDSLETQSDGGGYQTAESEIDSDGSEVHKVLPRRGILKNGTASQVSTTTPDTGRTNLSEFNSRLATLHNRLSSASGYPAYRTPAHRANLTDMGSEYNAIAAETTLTLDQRSAGLANLEARFQAKFGDITVPSTTLVPESAPPSLSPELLQAVNEELDEISPLDMQDIPDRLGLDPSTASQVRNYCRNVQNSCLNLVTASTFGAEAPILNSMYSNLASMMIYGKSAIGTWMSYLTSAPFNIASGFYNTGARVINGGMGIASNLGSMIYNAPSAIYNVGTTLGSTAYNIGKGIYDYGSGFLSALSPPAITSDTDNQTLTPSDEDPRNDMDEVTAANTAANSGISPTNQAPSATSSFGSTVYSVGSGMACGMQSLANGIWSGISGSAGYLGSYFQPTQARLIPRTAINGGGISGAGTFDPISLPPIDLSHLKTPSGSFL